MTLIDVPLDPMAAPTFNAPLNAPVVALTVPPLWFVAVVAVDALPLNAAVIVPALKLPDASRATMVLAVLALVALDVTVKVALPAWLAVKV